MLLAVDQVTKWLAEGGLEPGVRVDVLGDVLGFRLFYNSGAAFSLGTGITPVLTAFACVAVVAILVALSRSGSRRWSLALGALLGGALGNLTDRLLRPPGIGRGEVVDFIQVPFSFPIFNIADMAVVTGALSIVLLSLVGVELDGRRADGSDPASSDVTAPGPASGSAASEPIPSGPTASGPAASEPTPSGPAPSGPAPSEPGPVGPFPNRSGDPS